MPKLLFRVVVLLLVPCLAAEPIVASSFSQENDLISSKQSTVQYLYLFQQAGFIQRVLFHRHDYAPQILKVVNELFDLAFPPATRRWLNDQGQEWAALGPTS